MGMWWLALFDCAANAQHGHSTKEPGQIAQDFARFYLLTTGDAELFRWKWASFS